MADEALTPEQIWTGDLFDRKTEAEQLIAYIESVVARPVLREDKRAYTIAIDARYGEGKSFFLKRLAKHMALNHPVAFVDAWADDLADEPLTALAATLKQALEPFVDEPDVQDRLRTFMSKTGKVTKIAALGLLRRGLGLALTGGAVDAAADVLSGVSDDVSDAVNDGIKDASLAQVEEVGQAIRGVAAHRLMEERVNAFEEGKAAVQEMKDSLSAIVESLSGETLHPPIIIVIDELDRCRPTYAIKLLEEIKHLFDVPGLVFILALHADQLAHSVSGAYGSTFDGRAYLRRFIDREYKLAEPPLTPLLEHLCRTHGLVDSKISFPLVADDDGHSFKVALTELLAEYMRINGLTARDAFRLTDVLQTAVAIAGRRPLHGVYLLPLLIGHIQGLPVGQLPKEKYRGKWSFALPRTRAMEEAQKVTFAEAAQMFKEATEMTNSQLMAAYNRDVVPFGVRSVYDSRDWDGDSQSVTAVDNYSRLVGTVRRFSE